MVEEFLLNSKNMKDDSQFSPDFMPGYQMEKSEIQIAFPFVLYIFFLYKSIFFNNLFLDFRLLSGSSHI